MVTEGICGVTGIISPAVRGGEIGSMNQRFSAKVGSRGHAVGLALAMATMVAPPSAAPTMPNGHAESSSGRSRRGESPALRAVSMGRGPCFFRDELTL